MELWLKILLAQALIALPPFLLLLHVMRLGAKSLDAYEQEVREYEKALQENCKARKEVNELKDLLK